MALNMYLSIITLNENALNASTKRHIGYLNNKTRHIYLLPLRDPSQIERYTHTKRMEKDISCKRKGKKS